MRSGPAKASGFNKTDMAGNDTDLTSIIQQGQLVIQLTSPSAGGTESAFSNANLNTASSLAPCVRAQLEAMLFLSALKCSSCCQLAPL